jgi:phage tail sheath protein FI
MTPGVYVKEVSTGPRPIGAVGTSTAALVGVAPDARAHVNEPVACNNWSEFLKVFAGGKDQATDLARAVFGFFMEGGGRCYVLNLGDAKASLAGNPAQRTGLAALEALDDVAIVAAPGRTTAADYSDIISHCERMEDRFGILDPPDVQDVGQLTAIGTESVTGEEEAKPKAKKQAVRPPNSPYCAFYYPNIIIRDPDPFEGGNVAVPPSGHIAGIYARTDRSRGVHKAPANEGFRTALGLTYRVARFEQGELNRNGVNCLRYFASSGIRVWGARTLAPEASEWRYINVRRLFNMVKESIAEGTSWTVFEPNDELLWGTVIRDVSAFLTTLWRDGALFGATPAEAFFVKCDAENNPPESRDQGQLIVDVGIAPVKPAEFVTFRIGQYAGGSATAGAAEA